MLSHPDLRYPVKSHLHGARSAPIGNNSNIHATARGAFTTRETKECRYELLDSSHQRSLCVECKGRLLAQSLHRCVTSCGRRYAAGSMKGKRCWEQCCSYGFGMHSSRELGFVPAKSPAQRNSASVMPCEVLGVSSEHLRACFGNVQN